MSRLISVAFSYTDPVTEPVSLEEAKDYLRMDKINDEDTLITSLIKSARQKCEKILGLVLVDTSVKALYKNGGDLIEIAYGPVKTDEDGLPVIEGLGDSDNIKGFGNQIWVETYSTELELTYDSGWDETPEWAREAILKQVAWDYESRGDSDIKYVAQVNQKIAPETLAVLQPHRTTLHEILL